LGEKGRCKKPGRTTGGGNKITKRINLDVLKQKGIELLPGSEKKKNLGATEERDGNYGKGGGRSRLLGENGVRGQLGPQ